MKTKTTRLFVKVDPLEHAAVMRLAAAAGVSASQWIRSRIHEGLRASLPVPAPAVSLLSKPAEARP
jgi:predicted HicB family RNase H-like nuclease